VDTLSSRTSCEQEGRMTGGLSVHGPRALYRTDVTCTVMGLPGVLTSLGTSPSGREISEDSVLWMGHLLRSLGTGPAGGEMSEETRG